MENPDESRHALISAAITASRTVLDNLPVVQIEEAHMLILEALRNGNKLLLCGNGGSAAQAQHLAAEFVGHYAKEREPLPAIALTTDTSALTAIANDYGYERVFSRQIAALASEGDVLITFSTSGNSENVLRAMEWSTACKMKVIGLCGSTGGDIQPGFDKTFAQMCDVCIKVPHNYTPLIQQAHMVIGHTFCELIDSEIK